MEPSGVGRTEVVFINTAKSYPGAGPWLHLAVMRLLDRSRFAVVAACSEQEPGTPSPLMAAVQNMDAELEILKADFGPERLGAGLRGSWPERRHTVSQTLRAAWRTANLARVIRGRKPAIIYTDERPRDAAAAVAIARIAGARSIVHMHLAYGEWMSPLLKWSLQRADAIFAISDFVADSLIASGHDPSRIHVVLNAIDPSPWSPGLDRDEVRHEFGVAGDAPTVVTVCRLLPGKGTDVLISALALVRPHFPDVRLLVVGDEQWPGYEEHLRQIARDGGVLDCIHFTGRRSDVPRMMGAADLFVLPSVGEGFGLVFLEAMASGLAVVGARSGGVPEFVEDGVTGHIVEPDDVEGLAHVIRALLGDEQKRTAMGVAGQQLVAAEYTSTRLAADVGRAFDTLINQPAK